jgi:cytochrome c5
MKSAWAALWLTAGLLIAAGAGASVGEELYRAKCSSCHDGGTAGAPKLGDSAEWATRIKRGTRALYTAAIRGMPNTPMVAKGGFSELSDNDTRVIVDFMIGRAKLDAALLKAAGAYTATNPEFVLLDADHDGFLSRAEIAADNEIARDFARFDANRDGKLDEAEFLKLDAAQMLARAAFTVDDKTLADTIASSLRKTRAIVAGDVKIEVSAGVVTLKGMVDNAQQITLAASVARKTNGVKAIDNKLITKAMLDFD